MSDGFRLRIKYRIADRLAYLSHLETIRSMERVIRRAGLPFAITEGFNPHMKIAFGPALPVGAGSEGEYVDLRLNEYVAPEMALAMLQASAPSNLMPIACEYVGLRDDAIDIAYPVSVWHAEFACSADRMSDFKAAFDALIERGYIEVVKKKGRKEVIKRVEFADKLLSPPSFATSGHGVCMEFSTCQSEGGALRPDKFIAAALDNMDDAPALISLIRVVLMPLVSHA